MPLYDWACSCGHHFEGRSKDPEVSPTCPQCHQSATAVRLPSKPMAVRFRGQGFYETDYKGSKSH